MALLVDPRNPDPDCGHHQYDCNHSWIQLGLIVGIYGAPASHCQLEQHLSGTTSSTSAELRGLQAQDHCAADAVIWLPSELAKHAESAVTLKVTCRWRLRGLDHQ